jgi:hypothetical protein
MRTTDERFFQKETISMTIKSIAKIECLNPNTGRKMSIDGEIYELFSKAIYHTLKKNKEGITYTDIVDGIKKCFKEERTVFGGSIGWYAVTVKHDMEATGVIETFTEKGKKLHRLKK